MRSTRSAPVFLCLGLLAVACAPAHTRSPSPAADNLAEADVEVQNNSTVTVRVLCRRSSGRVIRLGSLGTGDTDRYELPLGCGRVFAQALDGKSVHGVRVRYLEDAPLRPRTLRLVATSRR